MTDIIPTGVIFTEKEYLFPYWRSFRLKYGPLLKPSPSCCESVQSWVCFPACRSSRCKLLRLLPNEVFSFAPFSPGNRAAASIVTKHMWACVAIPPKQVRSVMTVTYDFFYYLHQISALGAGTASPGQIDFLLKSMPCVDHLPCRMIYF